MSNELSSLQGVKLSMSSTNQVYLFLGKSQEAPNWDTSVDPKSDLPL